MLTAYLHDALTAEDKQRVEAWLRDEPSVRAQLSDLRQTQLWIKRDLRTHLDTQDVPSSMTFDAIASRLHTPRKRVKPNLRTRWVANFAGLAALFFLSFALIYSMGDIGGTIDPQNQPGSALVITATPAIVEADVDVPIGDSPTIPTPTPTPLGPTPIPNSSIPTRTSDS